MVKIWVDFESRSNKYPTRLDGGVRELSKMIPVFTTGVAGRMG